jgi:hypothetical protein
MIDHSSPLVVGHWCLVILSQRFLLDSALRPEKIEWPLWESQITLVIYLRRG